MIRPDRSGTAASALGTYAISWKCSVPTYMGDYAGIDRSVGVTVPKNTLDGGYQNAYYDQASGAGWAAPSTPTDHWTCPEDGVYAFAFHTSMFNGATQNASVRGAPGNLYYRHHVAACIDINGEMFIAPYDAAHTNGGLTSTPVDAGGSERQRRDMQAPNHILHFTEDDTLSLRVLPYHWGGSATTSHDLHITMQVVRLL